MFAKSEEAAVAGAAAGAAGAGAAAGVGADTDCEFTINIQMVRHNMKQVGQDELSLSLLSFCDGRSEVARRLITAAS